MAERFREKYKKSLKYEKRKEYDPEERGKLVKKLSNRFQKKYFFPELAFGQEYNVDNEYAKYKIAFFLLTILIIAILSTIGYTQIREKKDYKTENDILITIMSVTWFVLFTMTFLLFDKTREFNILLFVLIVTLSGYLTSRFNSDLYTKNDKEDIKNTNDIIIVINVFGGLLLVYLLYYYARKDPTDEILSLRKEKEDRTKRDKLFEQIRKAQKDAVEQEKNEWDKANLKSNERLKIIDDAIKAYKEKEKKQEKKPKTDNNSSTDSEKKSSST